MQNKDKIRHLKELAKLVRYYSLVSTTAAGSGHPTSSLSSCDIMTAIFFEMYKFELENPENPNNDRLIFSKGHASPLFYALYAAAGVISEEELKRLRKIDSPLEGHPTPYFKYTEAATGSLGQGLSVGVGEALALQAQFPISKSQFPNTPRVFVLLGDGEMAEGSVWEAIELAYYYKLNNLIAILDVNRLGQSQETMLGHNVKTYENRVKAFGWEVKVIDGHNWGEIIGVIREIGQIGEKKPTMIIAKTIKGKGVSFVENKDGWHGKAIPFEMLDKALAELGEVDLKIKGKITPPKFQIPNSKFQIKNPAFAKASAGKQKSKLEIPYKIGDPVATREAYGAGLTMMGEINPNIVALDGDTKNSTYSEKFKEKFPNRFFEMFIAEQNMVGTALGLAKRGFIPFASTFSAFFTRAFDQIRMSALSNGNIKLCGSHAGVSIGEDGASQMGLEDLSMMQSVYGSTVFYPSDGVSAIKLVEKMVETSGIVYMRTTRGKTPVIYGKSEEFVVGGCKVHSAKQNKKKSNVKSQMSKVITIVTAGITLHEALKAQEELTNEGIEAVVVDAYCIKPIDGKTIRRLARDSKAVITVEDHWIHGGLGDAVLQALAEEIPCPVYKLAVTIMPRSGKPEELLKMVGIDKGSIVKKAREILK